jgi:CTP synthase (UTP-ammonia lyase)
MNDATRIAVLGDRDTRHVTHRELDAALTQLPAGIEARWLGTERGAEVLEGRFDGVWVAPGGPFRDDAAVLAAIGHARRTGLPFLGTCSGFQYAALELATMFAGQDARHAEVDPDAEGALIVPLACTLYGERRTVTPVPGTRLAELLGAAPFDGFYYCGFGLDPGAAPALAAAGVRLSGHAPDAGVVALELPEHPFFVATAFQPQFGALAGEPLSSLIFAFAAAAQARRRSARSAEALR